MDFSEEEDSQDRILETAEELGAKILWKDHYWHEFNGLNSSFIDPWGNQIMLWTKPEGFIEDYDTTRWRANLRSPVIGHLSDPNNFLDMDLACPKFCAPAALKFSKPVDLRGRFKPMAHSHLSMFKLILLIKIT